MNTVVLLEVADGRVRSASLPAVTAARAIAAKRSGKVVGVVIGANVGAAAADAARFVDEVRVFDHAGLADALAETHAPALVAAMRAVGADALVGTASSFGKDVLPRAAALLAAGMASDVVAVLDADKFRRPTYAGNVLSEVQITTPTLVVSVRQSAFAAAAPAAAVGAVTAQDPGPIDALGAQIVGIKGTVNSRPDLSEAAIVVSGGRGMKSGENFKVLEELTDLLGGALGASRAACDAGMVPHDLQVGQTGKVVAPKLYIAVAISGAIQHLAGMKNSKVIVAINKDPEAPIFSVADYGLVATWEKAIPELIAAVKKQKGAGVNAAMAATAATVRGDTRIKAAEGVLSRPVDKGGVLVDARSGECFELNETGQLAWLLLTGGKTVAEAATTLVERFGVAPEVAQADVVALVETLFARKLVGLTP